MILVDVAATELLDQFLDLLLVLIGKDWLVLCLFFIVSLDLDSLLGHKGLQWDLLGNINDMLDVANKGNVEHVGVDVGASKDQLSVNRVVEVELQRGGSPLESAPEELSGVFDDVIEGEG